MKSPLRVAVFCGLAVLLTDRLEAHGGQYRGPPDVVAPPTSGPAGTSGGSPGTGPRNAGPVGPTGPGTGGAGGAGRPGAAGPRPGGVMAPGTGPTTTRGGMALLPDVTRWQFWWEFNKDRFIALKEAVHGNAALSGSDVFYMGAGRRREAVSTLAPSRRQIEQLLPALEQAMEETGSRDIVGAVMVAMAKIGIDHPDFDILELMADRLRSGDQEIRETAALSMGISQMASGIDRYLCDLAADTAAGRRLVGGGEVDYRTRSFAAYGLGLVAWATSDADLKGRCFSVLKAILEDDGIVSRDVRVAAINGMSLLAGKGGAAGGKESQLLQDCLKVLEGYYLKPMGAGDQLIQAHVPPAIARLLTRNGPEVLVRHYKDLFVGELAGSGRRSNDFQRSAALALGVLCSPEDTACSRALLEYSRNGRDQQARYFSLIALAQIGGDENRNVLLTAFERGSKGVEKPWGALALGVWAHETYERDGTPVDALVGRTLQRALADNGNPDTVAALAVGLGLCRYTDAADDLRDRLLEHRSQDALAGYLCIGLALMGDVSSADDITDIVRSSIRRPELLRQAAVALGKLGDKRAARQLGEMLRDGSQNLARLSSIASALGFIGDSGSITPLQEILFDGSLTELTRAFAAVALGGIADKEPLPWNAKIGANLNYRATVETLFDGASGILDIL